MTIVVDANLVVALATPDVRAPVIEPYVEEWLAAGEALHAPSLMSYEIANAFVRLVIAGRLTVDELRRAWAFTEALPIEMHPLVDGDEVVRVALRLGRQSAYDAAYIQLAQQLGAQLWTLDGPLYRNASLLGFPVRIIES